MKDWVMLLGEMYVFREEEGENVKKVSHMEKCRLRNLS